MRIDPGAHGCESYHTFRPRRFLAERRPGPLGGVLKRHAWDEMVNAEPEHDDLKRPQEKSLRGPHACSPRYLPSLFPYLIFTRPRGTFSFLPDLLSVDLLTAEKATAVYEHRGALRAYARGSGDGLRLEAVMDLLRNGLRMRKTGTDGEPS